MRLRHVAIIASLLAACRHPIEVRGLYAHDHGAGAFVPCSKPSTLLHVSDSALAVGYRRVTQTPNEPMFVRLRGVQIDSGSIYGGQHYFVVHQVLEIRTPGRGECPGVARAVSSVLH